MQISRRKTVALSKSWLLVLLLLNQPSAFSNPEPLALGTYFVPGYVESKKSGKYITQYHKIVELLGSDVHLEFQPTRRIQHNFLSKRLTGYFPELVEFMPDDACRTEAIDRKVVHIFTRNDRPTISNWLQLDDLKIAAVSGYSYGNEVYARPHLDITYSKNDVSNIKMLVAGRIDAVLGDHATTLEAIKQLGVQDYVKYNPDFKLAVMDVFWVFQNDKQGLDLCRRVSEAITTIKAQEPGKIFYEGLGHQEKTYN